MRRDLAVHRPGMRVRRQSIRRATPRLSASQIYALVLMFLCVMTIISLGGSPVFAARHLEVHGATFTGEQTVRAIVGIDGSPNLFRLRTDRVAGELANLPAVESVRVETRLPDTVVVTLVERAPRLIWVIGDRRYVVDDAGFLFGQVDSAGNPVPPLPAAGPLASGSNLPADSSSGASSSASPAGSPATTAPGASVDGSEAPATDRPQGAKATPKATPLVSPAVGPATAPSPTATLAPPPSLLPVPPGDPAQSPGPEVVNLPTVYDRRADDARLTLGGYVDTIALDAGYRLAGLTPADVGSQASGLDVVLDDQYGFTLSSGPDGWVAQFGFYTETLRKDTVIPMQVRDLRDMLLHYGESHVAWVWLVADIAGNSIDTYLAR